MMFSDKLSATDVADRLEQAAACLKRMPKFKIQGYVSSMPAVVQDFNEAYGYNDTEVRLGPPGSKHISEMDEAMTWLLWLEQREAESSAPIGEAHYAVRVLWMRANDIRWKTIERRLGWGITKLKTDWKLGLLVVAEKVNADLAKRLKTKRNILKMGAQDSGAHCDRILA